MKKNCRRGRKHCVSQHRSCQFNFVLSVCVGICMSYMGSRYAPPYRWNSRNAHQMGMSGPDADNLTASPVSCHNESSILQSAERWLSPPNPSNATMLHATSTIHVSYALPYSLPSNLNSGPNGAPFFSSCFSLFGFVGPVTHSHMHTHSNNKKREKILPRRDYGVDRCPTHTHIRSTIVRIFPSCTVHFFLK